MRLSELGEEVEEEGGIPAGTFEFAAHRSLGRFELGEIEGEAAEES